MEAGGDSGYESDPDSDSDFDVEREEDGNVAELADEVAATHLRNHKPIPLAIRASLKLKDSKEEPASEEIIVESIEEAAAQKPGEADFKVTEETPVTTYTLAATPILEFPAKSSGSAVAGYKVALAELMAGEPALKRKLSVKSGFASIFPPKFVPNEAFQVAPEP